LPKENAPGELCFLRLIQDGWPHPRLCVVPAVSSLFWYASVLLAVVAAHLAETSLCSLCSRHAGCVIFEVETDFLGSEEKKTLKDLVEWGKSYNFAKSMLQNE